jgi:hypothetical protein
LADCGPGSAIPVSALAGATGVERQNSEARWQGCLTPVGESRHGRAGDDCLCEMIGAAWVRPAGVASDVQGHGGPSGFWPAE